MSLVRQLIYCASRAAVKGTFFYVITVAKDTLPIATPLRVPCAAPFLWGAGRQRFLK